MGDGHEKKGRTSRLADAAVGTSSRSLEEGLSIPRSTVEKLLDSFLHPDAFRPFRKEDLAFAVIDLLRVSFYPRQRFRYGRLKVHNVSSTRELGLPYDVKVRYASRSLLQWTPPPETGIDSIEQHLDRGWEGKVMPSLTQTVHLNALRYIRGDYGRHPVGPRDNFIVEGSPSDIRREVLRVVVEVVANARRQYLALLSAYVGTELGADDVDTVVEAIEIAIDVPCKYAYHATTRWTDPWVRNLKTCSIHCDEARWLNGSWYESEYYKLYPKAFDRLRFEYGPNKARMTAILGHVLRISTAEALGRDLDALGKDAFARILKMQREVDTRDLRVIALDTFIALMPSKTRAAWSKIAPSFLADGRFFNEGSDDTCRKLLTRLVYFGLVRHMTRGHWRATPEFARFLRAANTLLAPHSPFIRRVVDERDVASRARGRVAREGKP